MKAEHIEKKCPGCGHWYPAIGEYNDQCPHCGTYFDRKEVEKIEEEKKKKKMPWEDVVFWVHIKPNEFFLIAFFKRILQFAQLIFVTVVSIILWITVAVAG